MIIAKVRKSGRYNAEKLAKKIAANFRNKYDLSTITKETACYFFVETVRRE